MVSERRQRVEDLSTHCVAEDPRVTSAVRGAVILGYGDALNGTTGSDARIQDMFPDVDGRWIDSAYRLGSEGREAAMELTELLGKVQYERR